MAITPQDAIAPRLVERAEDALPAAERAACDALWERTWPTPPGEQPDPDFLPDRFARFFLLDADGDLLAVSALIDRTITIDGEPHRIAGLQGVVVEEAQRGKGYGAWVVRAAVAAARRRGFGVAVLFCDPWNQPFYERLGWHALGGEIVQQRRGQDERVPAERDVVMAQPLSDGAAAQLPTWQTARVHVGIGQW